MVFVDGNGLLHPRACGLACSLGVVAGLPSIGVAKKLLAAGVDPLAIRARARELLSARGDLLVIEMRGADARVHGGALAAMLRMAPAAAAAAAPVYVSVGDKMSLGTAVALTLLCSIHRVPEPIRQADLRSREEVRRWLAEPTVPEAGSSTEPPKP